MYAVLDGEIEDEVSMERSIELLKKEFTKPKYKPDIVRELIKRTLKYRRKIILEGSSRPEEVTSTYPHLRKAAFVSYNIQLIAVLQYIVYVQVSYEFDLIIDQQNTLEIFCEAWKIWESAIIEYAKASLNIPKQLQHALRDLDSEEQGINKLTSHTNFIFCMLMQSVSR